MNMVVEYEQSVIVQSLPVRLLRLTAAQLRARPQTAAIRRHLRMLQGHIEKLTACSTVEQADNVFAAMTVVSPWLKHLQHYRWRVECPAYPRLDQRTKALLVLGTTPSELSKVQGGKGLIKREAHEWLLRKGGTELKPGDFLLMKFVKQLTNDEVYGVLDAGLSHSSVASADVARWFIAVYKDRPRWNALTRLRCAEHAGRVREWRYCDRLDELKPCDLEKSVEKTFRNAVDRMMRELEKMMKKHGDEPLNTPPKWWRPARCARLLLTTRELFTEGEEMEHCVKLYAPMVASGESVIVAFNVLGHRSTAELTRDTCMVVQHQGVGRSSPPLLCQKAMVVLLKRWQGLRKASR